MVLMAMKRVVLIISVSDTVLYVSGTCSDFVSVRGEVIHVQIKSCSER